MFLKNVVEHPENPCSLTINNKADEFGGQGALLIEGFPFGRVCRASRIVVGASCHRGVSRWCCCACLACDVYHSVCHLHALRRLRAN